MSKRLRDILGEAKTKITDGSTGSEPGIDYAPIPKGEERFVKKHKMEKHIDASGDLEYKNPVKTAKHPRQSKETYESTIDESCPKSHPKDCKCTDCSTKKDKRV